MMSAPRYTPAGESIEPFVPYHSEDEPPVFCWEGCHGFLVGPPGKRLCVCPQPGSVSPAFAALRDVLAERYRRRWFRILMPLLDNADEYEARGVWDGLWPAAQERAARRLTERGLR